MIIFSDVFDRPQNPDVLRKRLIYKLIRFGKRSMIIEILFHERNQKVSPFKQFALADFRKLLPRITVFIITALFLGAERSQAQHSAKFCAENQWDYQFHCACMTMDYEGRTVFQRQKKLVDMMLLNTSLEQFT